MGMPAGQVAFVYLAAVSVASAILAVTRRNPVHSVLWVLALFLHVAGLFLLAGAQFLAVVQIIVYAGAILVFYLFFLMLTDLAEEEAGPRFSAHWPIGLAAGVLFAALAFYAVPSFSPPAAIAPAADAGSLHVFGTALFRQFILPFEILSLILLAAIVGAVVVARRRSES